MIRAGLLALLLGGCVLPVDTSPSCNAETVQGWIGQKFSDRLSRTLQRKTGSRAVRVIRPGMAVTMDYRAGRLNITLDEKDMVTALRCG
ncbi:I78 family peptidase inhibitor [Sphingomonas donggukensis]|uniref:I78 family peptidase inhibitor n=1 Tax=Sphingomonas donggukensis TaxID=2949093 RepID=A0ABY4TWQ6_9SPHN|nr:I78 family peptidase inhibitor [Sphingomonas donggukensis]URW76826.1 I78 family peptidase inhibitor [Sphingomonas donggukensis]